MSGIWRLITLPALLSFAPAALALTQGYVPTGPDYVFYTFSLCGIAFATLIILAYKQYRWLVYAGFSLLLVVDAAGMDGTLAYLVGENDFIVWVVPFLLSAGTASYGYGMIALRLEHPHGLARLKPIFVVLAVVSALFALSSYFWLGGISLSTMWVPVNVLFFGMVLGQILPPLTWPRIGRWQPLLMRIFPVVVGLLAIVGYGIHFSLGEATQHDLNYLNRWILLVFAGFSLTLVIGQAFASTQQTEAAERQALEAAKQEAELQLALAQAGQAYEQALSVAAHHRTQLASVSHDLKQPISALRVAIDQLQRTQSGQETARLAKALDYIDSLSHSYIDAGTAEETVQMPDHREVVPTAVFAQTLRQMFSDEAARQAIDLTVLAPEYRVNVEPLAAMRIMTNLIGNALAHSGATRILVGFRRKGDRVVFQVHDNGQGMSEALLGTVRLAGSKGELSQGHGLGLSIVQALCEAQGMPFTLDSSPGRGTSAYVEMAAVTPPNTLA